MTKTVLKTLIENLVKTHPNPKQAFIDTIASLPSYTEDILRIATVLKIKFN